MRSSPLDVTEGVRGALRSLLTVTLGPGECGGVFLATEPRRMCLVVAAPSEKAFRSPAISGLARRAALESAGTPVVPRVPVGRAWPSALAVALPRRQGSLVVLASVPLSDRTRLRAPILASLVSDFLHLGERRRGEVEGDERDLLERILELARSDPDPKRCGRDVLDLAMALTGSDVAALWVQEGPGDPFELLAACSSAGLARPQASLPAGTLDNLKPAKGRPQSHARSTGRRLLGAPAVRSALAMPVDLGDNAFGLVAVGRLRNPEPFGALGAERLAALADLAAFPLARAVLGRGHDLLAQGFGAARRLARALTEGSPLEEALPVLARALQRIVVFDTAAVVLLDEPGDATVHALSGSEDVPRALVALPGWRTSQVGVSLRQREARILGEVSATAPTLLPFVGADPDLRAAVVVPLVADREPLGALILASRVPGHFRRGDILPLRPAARVLALALHAFRARRAVGRRTGASQVGPTTERRPAEYAAIGRLAEVLAHEIRNPLTVIGTTMQYLRNRRLVGEEYIPLLEAAIHKAREVDESLDSLLSLSRPMALRLEPAPIGPLLDEVAEFIRLRAAERAVDVAVRARPELIAKLDRRLLGQALLNLALNAIDAMRGGGRLEFGARRLAGSECLAITVTDTGNGIAPESLDVVFEPYYTTKLHGTGLGLAITRRIVEEHGGSIRVSSAPNQGTTFTVTLAEHR